MELEASYPVVVTDKLIECRDFYTRWFGFRVVFEATWFVYLKPSDESPHGIAFMKPDHPSQPPGPEAFDGHGILLTFQVSDAASEFERVQASDSSPTTRSERNRGVSGDSGSETPPASLLGERVPFAIQRPHLEVEVVTGRVAIRAARIWA